MTSWKLAADEHGILGVADTRTAGLTPKAVARLVSKGELTSLGRGWYAVGSPDTPEERHVLLTRAALRAHEGRAVASHHSALCLLRLPTYRADFETVRLNRVTSGAPRTRRGQRLGRVVPAEAIAPPQGGSTALTTVSPALAVVQAAISGGPLAGLVAADAALSRDLATRPVSTRHCSGSTSIPGHSSCAPSSPWPTVDVRRPVRPGWDMPSTSWVWR